MAVLTTDSPQVQEQFLERLRNPWKMQFFYFWRLPSLFWWGVRVAEINRAGAIIRLPFSWRTQNPFQSVYFAAQMGAAELSTGLLVLAATQGHGKISMLVVGSSAEFLKKATGPIHFHCKDGVAIWEAVERAVASGEPQSFVATSEGMLENGQVVSRMSFQWSVLAKN